MDLPSKAPSWRARWSHITFWSLVPWHQSASTTCSVAVFKGNHCYHSWAQRTKETTLSSQYTTTSYGGGRGYLREILPTDCHQESNLSLLLLKSTQGLASGPSWTRALSYVLHRIEGRQSSSSHSSVYLHHFIYAIFITRSRIFHFLFILKGGSLFTAVARTVHMLLFIAGKDQHVCRNSWHSPKARTFFWKYLDDTNDNNGTGSLYVSLST